MVKILVVVLALLGVGYFVVTNLSSLQGEVDDPHYVEIRIDISVPKTGEKIQLVGFVKMHSFSDCNGSDVVWKKIYEGMGDISVSPDCKKTLPEKFKKLFNNEQATATYMAFDYDKSKGRDSRFLIYGAPSNMAYDICNKLIAGAKNEAQSPQEFYCVKGSVG